MNESVTPRGKALGRRVQARCLQRGWDVSEFARQARLSRTTAHQILAGQCGQPRRSTLARIAAAFEISPAELCDDGPRDADASVELGNLEWAAAYDRRTNPVISEVAGEWPALFAGWSAADWDELYSTFGVGGELTETGVRRAAENINRKRETARQLSVLLETHLGDVAMRMIETLYRMVQPVQNLEPSETLDRLILHKRRTPAD